LVERSEWVGLVLAQPCVEHSLQKLGGFAITALAAEWFAQRSIKIANPHRRRLPSLQVEAPGLAVRGAKGKACGNSWRSFPA